MKEGVNRKNDRREERDREDGDDFKVTGFFVDHMVSRSGISFPPLLSRYKTTAGTRLF